MDTRTAHDLDCDVRLASVREACARFVYALPRGRRVHEESLQWSAYAWGLVPSRRPPIALGLGSLHSELMAPHQERLLTKCSEQPAFKASNLGPSAMSAYGTKRTCKPRS